MLAGSIAELDRIAVRGARSYAKRLRGGVAYDDLHQEAWIAILLAHRSWKPELGPFDRYASTAVRRWLWSFSVRQMAPVSGSNHRLRSLLETTGVQMHQMEGRIACTGAQCAWQASVRRAVTALILRVSRNAGSVVYASCLARIIFGLADARTEAARNAIDVGQLYRLTARLRTELSGSSTLWQLWRKR